MIKSLDKMLLDLKLYQEQILNLIDEDPKLRKSEVGELVIANASKSLFTPEEYHQLFAKGIVYTRNPYRLVSLPLIKIYNLTEREDIDMLIEELLDNDCDLTSVFKEDGFMFQIFEHEGVLHFTTRSTMDDYIYVDSGKSLIEGTQLMNPNVIKGKTVVCECIASHDGIEGGLNLNKDHYFRVISIFDHETYSYWSSQRVVDWSLEHGVKAADVLGTKLNLEAVKGIVEQMNQSEDLQEGCVVCLEKNGEILHRVKMKTQKWVELFRAYYNVSLKNVARFLWVRPDIVTFDHYKQTLVDLGELQEEFIGEVEVYFNQYMSWKEGLESYKQECEQKLSLIIRETNDPREVFERCPKEDRQVMMALFRGKDPIQPLLKRFELFPRSSGILYSDLNNPQQGVE